MFYNNLYSRSRNCSNNNSQSMPNLTINLNGKIKRHYITTSQYSISISEEDLLIYSQIDYIVKVPCIIFLPKGILKLVSYNINIRNISEINPSVQINCHPDDHIHHDTYLPPTGGQTIFVPLHHKFHFTLTDYDNQFIWTIT